MLITLEQLRDAIAASDAHIAYFESKGIAFCRFKLHGSFFWLVHSDDEDALREYHKHAPSATRWSEQLLSDGELEILPVSGTVDALLGLVTKIRKAKDEADKNS